MKISVEGVFRSNRIGVGGVEIESGRVGRCLPEPCPVVHEKRLAVASVYMTVQQPASLSPLTFLTCNATRAASVKASLTPRFRFAEHSVLC